MSKGVGVKGVGVKRIGVKRVKEGFTKNK